MVWGSNVPQTRTPDAHFYTEVRYKGTKTVAVSSDFGEMVKFGDIWLAPKQGTDAAGHGHGPCDPEGIPSVRRLGLLPRLRAPLHRHAHAGAAQGARRPPCARPLPARLAPGRRAGEQNNPDWKTLVYDEDSGDLVAPNGSIGFRWGEGAVNGGEKVGRWNPEARDGGSGRDITPRLSLIDQADAVVGVGFPYFGGEHDELLTRNVPARRIRLADGTDALVATVYDPQMANYGLDRGLGGGNVATSYDDDVPYTPAWQEKHTRCRAPR